MDGSRKTGTKKDDQGIFHLRSPFATFGAVAPGETQKNLPARQGLVGAISLSAVVGPIPITRRAVCLKKIWTAPACGGAIRTALPFLDPDLDIGGLFAAADWVKSEDSAPAP
jgi:hypothetical protein